MLEVNQLAKCLIQLLIKHKCIKERNFVELINGRSRINIILNKINDLLKFSGCFVSIELINGEEYFVMNFDLAVQPIDIASLVKNKSKRKGEDENRESGSEHISKIEKKREDSIRKNEVQDNEKQENERMKVNTNYKTTIDINVRDDSPFGTENEEVRGLLNEQSDQNTNHKNNLNNIENVYDTSDSIIHEFDMESENNLRHLGVLNEGVKVWDLIPEEMLYSCKLKKSELAIYYLIVHYILKNQKFLKISNDECTFENMCSELKINTKEHQKTVLNRLLIYNWIKRVNENEISLGKRFYTDLINCMTNKGNAVCSSCKNPLVVEVINIKFSIYFYFFLIYKKNSFIDYLFFTVFIFFSTFFIPFISFSFLPSFSMSSAQIAYARITKNA